MEWKTGNEKLKTRAYSKKGDNNIMCSRLKYAEFKICLTGESVDVEKEKGKNIQTKTTG